MIKDFGFIIPQNCQFGMGALKKLPDFLKAAGSTKVMLISDRMLEEIGVVDKVRKILADGGLEYAEYLDVVGNPTTDIVKAAGDKYVAEKCNGLLAVGGGSPMDVAKAVGVVAKFGGDIDPVTARTIDRGRKNQQILCQPQYHPWPVENQVAVIYAGVNGLLENVPLDIRFAF